MDLFNDYVKQVYFNIFFFMVVNYQEMSIFADHLPGWRNW